MKDLMEKLRREPFQAYLAAFLVMLLPSAALFFVAESGSSRLIWILLLLVVLANILAMLIP